MKNVLIILLLALSTTLSATKYYVSTSGNDAANGLTETTAWKTLKYAESRAIAPGDIIALKKGDNWSSTNALGIQHGGAVGNPIIWDGSLWGTGANAIISASGKHPDASGSTGGAAIVAVTGCKNVTFQNITIDGNNFYAYGIAIGGDPSMAPNARQNDERYITIQDCNIIDIGGPTDYCIGIFLRTWFNNMADIKIQRNNLNGISSWGIGAYLGRLDYGAPSPGSCFDLYIGYNTITNVGTSNDGLAKGIGLSKAVTRCIIEHNNLTQGANGHAVGGIALAGWEGVCPTGVIIRYNDIRMTDQPALITEGGYPMQVDAYFNKFYTNLPAYGVVWIFPPNAASYSGGYLRFYNNVIASNKGAAFKDEGGTANLITLKNNILINTATDNAVVQTSTSIIHSNNAIWRPASGNLLCVVEGSNYKYRNDVTAWEPTATISDPLLANLAGFDWHLKAGSPAIGKGIAIAGLSSDYDGLALKNPPSIGAFENGSAVAAPVVPAAPVYQSAVVENVSPSIVNMTYNTTLANIVPATSAFKILVNSTAMSVSSVSVTGSVVKLNLINAVKYGDVVTVAYTTPATNPLQTATAGIAISISGKSVVNNIVNPTKDATSVTIKMTITPNPVHMIINGAFVYSANFSAQNATFSPQVMKIYDNNGRLYLQKSLTTGVASVRIPVNLRRGVYKVTLTSGVMEMSSQKIIVN